MDSGLGGSGLSRGCDLAFSGFVPGGGCGGSAPDGCGGPVSPRCAGMAVSTAKSALVLGDCGLPHHAIADRSALRDEGYVLGSCPGSLPAGTAWSATAARYCCASSQTRW